MLKAFKASSEGVVASTGTSNFWIVASDSRGNRTWYVVEFNRLGVAKAD